MTENDNKYRVYLDGGGGQDPLEPQPQVQEPRVIEEIPFCLGIVGDFSGRESRREKSESPDLARRPIHRVTPENVLDVCGLSPRILIKESPEGSSDLSLTFSSLEDFHPDSLYLRLDLFRRFRDARERISRGEAPGDVEPETITPPVPQDGPEGTEPAAGPGGGLLDAVLGETERETPPAGSPLEEDLDAFIRRVLKPHVVENVPDRSARLEELDGQAGKLMSALLHSPEFQELEALWRSVVFLLSRIPVSTNLRVYVIDISKGELAADLLTSDEPTEWGFAQTVLNPVSENGEALRWAALLGAFEFGDGTDDLPLLQRIALLAETGGVPWIAGGHTSLFGSRSIDSQPEPRDWTDPLDPFWVEFRERPEAGWVSLCFPGFLLRPPYGEGGRSAKEFAFLEEAAFPDELLWGNPCHLWGVVLAQAFSRSGWALRLRGRESVLQLPTCPTPEGWETSVKVNLSHSAAARVLELGLNPVVSGRGEPEVQLLGMGSVSTSPGGLKSWWNSPV